MRVTYRCNGAALRRAMSAGGWKLKTLADRTAEVDPAGRGVSFQLIAFLRTTRYWGRDRTSARSARLITAALGAREDDLFTLNGEAAPADSPEPRDNVPVT